MKNPYQDRSSIDPQNDFRREIPTPTFNALAAARLSGAEYQIILVVVDRSWGWSKASANISLGYFEKATQLSRHSVINAIKSLEQKRIVIVNRYKVERSKKAQVNEYLLNKHYDTWLLGFSSEENDTTPRQGSGANDTRVVEQTALPSEVNDTTSSAMPKAKCSYPKEKKEIIDKESIIKKNTPYQEIVDLYHSLCPSLPRIRELTERRKKALKTICHKKNEPLAVFRELFSKAESSDFLSGRHVSADQHKNWRCSFDWLLEEKNRLKVLEGNYDNKPEKGIEHGRRETEAEETGRWPGFRVIESGPGV